MNIAEIAHNSLLGYAQLVNKNYKIPKHIRMIARALEAVERGEIKRLLISVPPRHGKLIAHSVPVLTPEGWKKHGELKVGDFVFHPDGMPIEVIALSEPAAADYTVNIDGELITCHANHEWEVYDRSAHKWRIIETWEMAERKLTRGTIGSRGGRYELQVRNIEPLDYSSKLLPIDPYFLGCWLGDGKSSDVALCYSPNDCEPITEIQNRGFQISWRATHRTTGVVYCGFGNQGLRQIFKETTLLNNKHIPSVYLRGSIDQRLDLLAGLIDTDGHVERSTGRVRIATCSEQLCNDILELCRSLGFRPYVYSQEPVLSSSGIQGKQIVHYVGFQPTIDIPTKIPRKRIARLVTQRRRPVLSIHKLKPELGRCIQVDSDDGLYLVGETLIPTHNSMLCSQYFPAWYLGRNPDKYIITATYGQELSDDFGRKVRDQLREPAFKAVFPKCVLREDTQSVSRMLTSAAGSYFGVGVGGPITGRGGHLLLIDDPIKDREQADSQVMREKIADWYRSTAYTRLMPNGAVVVIMTRWNQEDLIGYLKDKNTHENWTELRLPALSDDGDPLWPEAYSKEALDNIYLTMRADGNEYDWHSLYQQNPIPREGVIFKSEWLKEGVDEEYPAYYAFIDPAISKSDYADETAMSVLAPRYSSGQIDEVETIYGKWDFHEQLNMIDMLWSKYKKKMVLIGVETVAYQHALHQELHARGLPVVAIKADKDKIRRAYSITHLFSQGRVRINTPKLRTQLIAFRGGDEKNDLVDACVSGLRLILENSSLKYDQPKNELEKLDMVSKQFWEQHQKSIKELKDGQKVDPNKLFGF